MAVQRLDARGYLMRRRLLASGETRALDRVLRPVLPKAGEREMLQRPWAAALAARIRQRLVAYQLLAADAVAVQCTLFDKTPGRNWLVTWHQDLSVPVRGHTTDAGWGGWSDKQGVRFVQPPSAWLARLLAVRLHVDPCGPDRGPLRVLPGSHRHGRLDAAHDREQTDPQQAGRWRYGEVVCTADAGDALLMRPLILHASSRMTGPGAGRRRVLHLVYAPPLLPDGLEWHAEV